MIVRESLEFQRGLTSKKALSIGSVELLRKKIEEDEDFLDDFITDLATDNGLGYMQSYLSISAQKTLATDILINGKKIREARLWIDEMGDELGLNPDDERDEIIKAYEKKYLKPLFLKGWEFFHDTDQEDFIEYILIK